MVHQEMEILVLTPHEQVLSTQIRSLRIPVESGYVGLHPSVESHVSAFEAGVINYRTTDRQINFLGTAGGLLICDGMRVTLLTPIAVVGENEETVLQQIDKILSHPTSEMETRTMLSRLEGKIVEELQKDRSERVV
ncbi:MAG: hypothetical protein HUJ26_02240 [Planctomycetaceae bacterium]|nr:hypothetical protein [Planctomycetaceae bacterium]